MQRNRNIAYDDDDLYDDADDDYSADPEYTDEDLSNFATLTPVVRAELDEAGLQASNREIEDALWESYWDVGSCVVYFKNKKGEKKDGKVKQQGRKKEKPKSRFDEAAEKNVGAVGGDSGGEFFWFSLL